MGTPELVVAIVVAAVCGAGLAALVGRLRLRSSPAAEVPALSDEIVRLEQRISDVAELVRGLDSQRSEQFGQVTEQMRAVARVHQELSRTTGDLREVLASSQARGQWGERMAEDVLRAAGMVEGINYRTLVTTASGPRPDITYQMPNDRVVHMDVKFPLGRYIDMLRADEADQRAAHQTAFLRAVRDRVHELDGRGYINPHDGTLDCVLLFIPNDQIYGFVHEHQPQLLDDALAKGVVICSPTTLFAVLAVIRQATEQFALERTSDEILALLASFSDQWQRFVDAIDRVGRGLETTQRAYEALTSTRRNQLERHLERIDQLRRGEPAATRLHAVDGNDAHTR